MTSSPPIPPQTELSILFPMLPSEETMQVQIMKLIQQCIQLHGDHPRTMHLQLSDNFTDAMTGSATLSFDTASLVPAESQRADDSRTINNNKYHHNHRHHSPGHNHHHEHRDLQQQPHHHQHTYHHTFRADEGATSTIPADSSNPASNENSDMVCVESSQSPTNTAGFSSASGSTHSNNKISNLSRLFSTTVSLDTKIRMHHVEIVYSTVIPQPAHGEVYFKAMHFPTITDAISNARSLFDSIGHADLYIRITSVWKITRYFKYSTHRTTMRLHQVVYDRGGTKKNHNHTWIRSPSPSPPIKRRKL